MGSPIENGNWRGNWYNDFLISRADNHIRGASLHARSALSCNGIKAANSNEEAPYAIVFRDRSSCK
jgi:hypothetical protein